MKQAIFIIALCLSSAVGYLYGKKNNQSDYPSVSIHKRIPKANPESSESGMNCTDQLEQAKKLHGEAFLLFLANVGVKLSGDQKQDFKKMLDHPQNYKPDNFANTDSIGKKKEMEVSILQDIKSPEAFQKYLKENEANLENIPEGNLTADAKSFILEDPGLFYVRSKFIKSFKAINPLNGNYSGKLYLIIGKDKGETHDIEMALDFQENQSPENEQEKDKIDGTFNLKISEDGNVYSNSRGNGGNGDIRINNGSLIIEASPSSFFHFKDEKITTANYYENNKLIGFAQFRKMD